MIDITLTEARPEVGLHLGRREHFKGSRSRVTAGEFGSISQNRHSFSKNL